MTSTRETDVDRPPALFRIWMVSWVQDVFKVFLSLPEQCQQCSTPRGQMDFQKRLGANLKCFSMASQNFYHSSYLVSATHVFHLPNLFLPVATASRVPQDWVRRDNKSCNNSRNTSFIWTASLCVHHVVPGLPPRLVSMIRRS